MQKSKKPILRIRNTFSLIILAITLVSCGLSEYSDIDTIKIKGQPKIATPLAYGTIDVTTLFYYINPYKVDLPPDDNGYYSFGQIVAELAIPDTFAFNGQMLQKISEVAMHIETSNGLPLGADVELNFIDTTTFKSYGKPIVFPVIDPAVVNIHGKVTNPTYYKGNVAINRNQLAEFSQANGILMNILLYLPESEAETIYFNIHDTFSLNVWIEGTPEF